MDSPENPVADSPGNLPPEENKSEVSFIARLAAELATPMAADPDVPLETKTETPHPHPQNSQDEAEKTAESVNAGPGPSESVISPERMAMRQLQGRLRKNLLLKRPSPTSSEHEEAPETVSADAESAENHKPQVQVQRVQPQAQTQTQDDEEDNEDYAEPVFPVAADVTAADVTAANATATVEDEYEESPETESFTSPGAEIPASPSVELVTQPETSADTQGEVGLIAQSGANTSLNLKTEEMTEKPAIQEAELPAIPKREVIRIEKSSESFTHLHTAIEYAVGNPNFHTDGLTDSSLFQANRPVVMGVTSAIAGEGKTTVALHLAMDIARNNFKKVCLIDMGLGEDTLSRRLEINSITGLVNVLEGTDDAPPTIETVKYEGLSIMPAGKTPENPARAARSPLVLEVLTAARKLFDVIIVDMPSVSSGNVSPIAPHLDAMVMVVYAGVTPKEVVAGALERLDQHKILGVVLNRVTTSMPSWLQRRLNRW